MSRYTPETVTLWVVQTESPEVLPSLFEFPDVEEDEENGDADEPQSSAFAQAYRLGWYDSDFADLGTGESATELLKLASENCRTLDEQALSRLPEGEWNGIYLIYGQAGEDWKTPEGRPPMPHGVIVIEGAKFKLVDTFYVLLRP